MIILDDGDCYYDGDNVMIMIQQELTSGPKFAPTTVIYIGAALSTLVLSVLYFTSVIVGAVIIISIHHYHC